MRITDFLEKECISVCLESHTKEAIITELLDLIVAQHPDIDPDEARRGLYEREKIVSTAIGRGIAIPHAQLQKGKNIIVALGLVRKVVDFDSLDKQPVKLVFMILYPKDKLHLQLRFLARVSRLLLQKNLHDNLLQCQSPDEVLKTLKQYEDVHFH